MEVYSRELGAVSRIIVSNQKITGCMNPEEAEDTTETGNAGKVMTQPEERTMRQNIPIPILDKTDGASAIVW